MGVLQYDIAALLMLLSARKLELARTLAWRHP